MRLSIIIIRLSIFTKTPGAIYVLSYSIYSHNDYYTHRE